MTFEMELHSALSLMEPQLRIPRETMTCVSGKNRGLPSSTVYLWRVNWALNTRLVD